MATPIAMPRPLSDAERRALWLRDRETCITGTQIAAILGLSHFMSPIDVWMEKKGMQRDADEKPWLLAGKRFERAILEETASRAGRELLFADPYTLHRVPEFPLLGATLDATWKDTGCPVDAKNIRYKDDEWGEDGSGLFPMYYRLQLHIQMMATGKQEADLGVCFTGQDFARYTIGRDPEIDAVVKDEADRWWKKHILCDIAPDPDGSASFGEYLKQRFQRHTDVLIAATGKDAAVVEELRQRKESLKAAEAAIAQLEQELKSRIGEAQGIQGLCTWKCNRDSEKTDWQAAFDAFWDKFAPEHGLDGTDRREMVARFTSTQPGARVFRLKTK